MSEPAPAPATPRHAASLLVLRPTHSGPEVLMGLRGAGHKFMPNRLVFPGGAVDPADHAAPAASPLPAHVRRRLEVSADASLAHALGIAAARELLEETGLSLGAPPHLAPLDYLSRAVTPPVSPIRFDARFFVVDAEAVSGTLAGSGELEDLRWFGVNEALALDLVNATRGVLTKLLEWLAMSPQERTSRTTTPAMLSRVWHEE
jgi:8-oxo-dGTP pyrophosphatase MutT (NUDIX family)